MAHSYVVVAESYDGSPRKVVGQWIDYVPMEEWMFLPGTTVLQLPDDAPFLAGEFYYTGAAEGFTPLPPEGWPDYLNYFEEAFAGTSP